MLEHDASNFFGLLPQCSMTPSSGEVGAHLSGDGREGEHTGVGEEMSLARVDAKVIGVKEAASVEPRIGRSCPRPQHPYSRSEGWLAGELAQCIVLRRRSH
jgi:hypothetical protein